MYVSTLFDQTEDLVKVNVSYTIEFRVFVSFDIAVIKMCYLVKKIQMTLKSHK